MSVFPSAMPAGSPDYRLSDWAEFLRIAAALDIGSPLRSAFVFRGQSRDWPLLPSLTRVAKKYEWTASQALFVESRAVAHFRTSAHLYVPVSGIPKAWDYMGWWHLMQHFGAPTRLLDWTDSPYVAAYFAADTTNEEDDGVIWGVHGGLLGKAMRAQYPEGASTAEGARRTGLYLNQDAPLALHFVRARIQAERMTAQQTACSVSPQILGDHGSVVAGALEPELECYFKLILPAEQKPTFLLRLRRMNMTAHALFPGVDGLGRSVRELVNMAGLQGPIEEPGIEPPEDSPN